MEKSELAKRLSEGDESALNDIITKYASVVSAVIFNVSGRTLPLHDVEELTADTFITLWYNREKVTSDTLEGYICTIAKNKARNKIKSNKYRQALDIDDVVVEDEFVVSESVENSEAEEALYTALDELGDPEKEIMLRHYFYYQPSNEIGTALNMNPQTVRTKMRRAKDKLKKILIDGGFTK